MTNNTENKATAPEEGNTRKKGIVFYIAIFIVSLCAVIAILVLCLNAYVQSAGFRNTVTEQGSAAIGRELAIKKIGFSIFSGAKLKLSGIEIAANNKAKKSAPLLIIETMDLSLSLGALLKQELQCDRIIIDGLHVELTRHANGSLDIDDIIKRLGIQVTTALNTPRPTLPQRRYSTVVPIPAAEAAPVAKMPLHFDKIALSNISGKFRDEKTDQLISLAEFNFAINIHSDDWQYQDINLDGNIQWGNIKLASISQPSAPGVALKHINQDLDITANLKQKKITIKSASITSPFMTLGLKGEINDFGNGKIHVDYDFSCPAIEALKEAAPKYLADIPVSFQKFAAKGRLGYDSTIARKKIPAKQKDNPFWAMMPISLESTVSLKSLTHEMGNLIDVDSHISLNNGRAKLVLSQAIVNDGIVKSVISVDLRKKRLPLKGQFSAKEINLAQLIANKHPMANYLAGLGSLDAVAIQADCQNKKSIMRTLKLNSNCDFNGGTIKDFHLITGLSQVMPMLAADKDVKALVDKIPNTYNFHVKGAKLNVSNGRAHLKNFFIESDNTFRVQALGSIGLDETLDIQLNITELQRGLTGDIKKACEGITLVIPIKGTVQAPQADYQAFFGSWDKIIINLAKMKAKGKIKDLIKEKLGSGLGDILSSGLSNKKTALPGPTKGRRKSNYKNHLKAFYDAKKEAELKKRQDQKKQRQDQKTKLENKTKKAKQLLKQLGL